MSCNDLNSIPVCVGGKESFELHQSPALRHAHVDPSWSPHDESILYLGCLSQLVKCGTRHVLYDIHERPMRHASHTVKRL